MADDPSKDPGRERPANSRTNEHRRRNQLQADLLKKAYDRHRHAAFVDAAIRRAREEAEKESDQTEE